ncbi:Ppx/GppA family phosphatase [Polymorphobacter multimanifer]|uniref:Exopolyphosphatase/guanosine-5'-triphosphate, 3'-diphosphate pyrophosphatase n=1 Tax=Polymorphobacter multimanifer TaxID=1070431 RepID=A0A841LAC3_9SPHN|nr:Ppx/GppA family phosphatase [Polymorphobacter multimanifer]MBB6225978.1 exopolyphosphatase/guanosine-5'-triphosphate,3'-diphosphate pyrophosphatase [Polymorphobacter multimanifer]
MPAADRATAPVGIIDIGSNSVRLVVYQGLGRVPSTMFNEKVMAGLGRGLSANGKLGKGAMDNAVAALVRFQALTDAMQLGSLRVVATAAVREASNADAFVARVRAECGLEIETISGAEEARGAALGVISGIPHADGVVGDLGGGSLELIRVADGKAHEQLSLPIGALRLEAVRKQGGRALAPFIKKALDKVGWAAAGRGKPFYMVGGSWRALAHLHMHMTDHALPIVHQYEMPATAPASLVRSLARIAPAQLKAVPNIASSRLPSLPGAAMLLAATIKRLGSSSVVASGFGLREGLLFDQLPPEEQALDPLLVGARAEGAREGRFPEHGDMLFDWMDGLFGDQEPADQRRLRLVACLLSDIAWRTHPDYRSQRAAEAALHGNWVAITTVERAALACALHFCLGGSADAPLLDLLGRLAPPDYLLTARCWGLALRLGQRLAGGTVPALANSMLTRSPDDGAIVLALHVRALAGDAVQRRLKTLSGVMQRESRIEFRD